MENTRINGAVKSGLARKPDSAGLGILVIVSLWISVISAGLLASDFLGNHAPGHAPHPRVPSLMLILGLAIAAVGQLFGAGRNEGIRARGWVGVIDVLDVRLTFAAIVFMGCVLKYAIAGKHISLYPVGLLTIVSGFVLASRALTKYIFKLDHRKPAKG
jgi:hypothetical protein